ncbi:ABC transporter family substrate-binding protein [Cellulomonas sp. C5510]|uniref:ABC transporter family substrate-binding protein n=1 Tax=Cellulomonas sp. C5510 TaxID=2871170 RepID=UPI001C98D616|nr:ABC transporter family substrate-binding protein [Cellulomonas sp. C5510]QZN86389.1 ABC transporter family substrate-binding protein [Cellulomonas sp. C5510]
MRITRKAAAAVSIAAAGALALTACSDSGSDDTTDDSGINTETSVNIAWNQPFYSYNQNSITGNATANSVITYLTKSGFNYYDQELNLVPDESFGTYEKTSDDPLTVEYTFADTAKWSDGVAVTPTDFLLEWAAQSGTFNNVEAEYDDEGNISNQDALDAGVYFDAASPCAALIETPEVDGSTITFTYTKPFADWETCMTAPTLPSHVVGQRALDEADAEAATQAVQDAILNNDVDTLSKIAKVWSTDFNYTELPDDANLYLSNGAYVMTDFVKDQYMTLKANEAYEGANTAAIGTVTVRWNGDPMGQVQALQNGEVDLISPQSTADVLEAIQAIDSLKVETSDEGTYEHIDLQFANGGPFDPATYGGDADKALKVRQAFLKTIPRQDIVDSLIKPLNENATVRSSFTVVPGSPNYDAVAEASGQDAQFGEVDIEGAKALLAEAGVPAVNVRLLFDPENTRRQNEFQLIAASAAEAGITVTPYQVQSDWGTDLSNATSYYDAALFGWQSQSTAVTESDANYRTDATNNFYGYSNPEVDSLFDELQVSTDPDEQGELLGQIEKHLVDDAFGVTLFQFPGVTAWNPEKIDGISKISINPTIFAGFWNWTPGSAASAS